MSHPLSQLATRASYLSRQLPRMAWYAGHLYVMRRLAEEVRDPVRNVPRAVVTPASAYNDRVRCAWIACEPLGTCA